MTRAQLPVIDPVSLESDAGHRPSIHGVVLAAGTSSRYGERNKLLEPIDGVSMVRRAVRTLCETGLEDVTVVLGSDHERVRDALEGAAVDCQRNERYEQGHSTSVQAGIEAARRAEAAAAVFALGDMPVVAPQSVELLCRAYGADCGSILAAGFEGQRGNPVLFDQAHFDALESLTGDTGGRELFQTVDDAVVVETGDPGVRRDIDRPADLERVARDVE